MWKYCEICCVSITIYIKEKKVQTEYQKKKNKTVTTVATVQLGTVVDDIGKSSTPYQWQQPMKVSQRKSRPWAKQLGRD